MQHYEWDEHKRQENLKKHGIDFVDAIDVFSDTTHIECESRHPKERRYQVIGAIAEQIVIFLYIRIAGIKSALFQPVEPVKKNGKDTKV